MSHQPELTHVDRMQRRKRILADWRAGMKATAIAEKYGLTVRYIRQVAADAGEELKPGRPRLVFSDSDQRHHYRKLRATLGAAYAREAMGIAA